MKKPALVHFSGGSDSTLCAALLAEEHAQVHLLTYDRVSFIGSRDYTSQNYERLCRIYGKDKFVRRVVGIDALHSAICYRGYLGLVREFKFAVNALAFSKLAMHWYSAAYALKNGIAVVADGAVPYMRLYPDQNEKICLEPLRAMYAGFGIEYRNPVYGFPDGVEQALYDKGVTEHPSVRGTESDRQVFYSEQVLLALFLKYELSVRGMEGYEERVGRLFRNRIGMMEREIRESARRGALAL